ncbi:hypothetical protein THRCLA_11627 [Thraustotheca clavata]|uniref:C2 domain-containing protein n=1 Tax=Thraustotheca clavata TaxID=74557 RepID=A0A1V9Y734_9STRA|nr:hypothetical protein THRCLA_11627 [Thraustotheca clavata]
MPELDIRVVCARNLHDAQLIGRQDPYCKIIVGGCEFQTGIAFDGGRDPIWNQVFAAQVYNPQIDEIIIEIWDESFLGNGYIGTCTLPVNMFLSGQIFDQWYAVYYAGALRGEINLRVQLRREMPMAAVPQGYPQAYIQQAPVYVQQPPVYVQQPQVVYGAPGVVYERPVVYESYGDNGGAVAGAVAGAALGLAGGMVLEEAFDGGDF